MLDQIWSLRNKNRFSLDTATYSPQQALQNRILSNPKGHKLAALFSPWHGAGSLYQKLARRLEKSGWTVVIYEFSPEILKPNIEQVVASFGFLQTAIAEDLNRLVSKHSYTDIHLIGTSLGSLPLVFAAEKFSAFTKVSMAGASSNLAGATWEGLRTQGIRSEFQKQGVTEAQLDVAWDSVAPKNHVQSFYKKPVNLVISRTDRVIPTKFQVEYRDSLLAAGAELDVTYTRLGHYASIINFCLYNNFDD